MSGGLIAVGILLMSCCATVAAASLTSDVFSSRQAFTSVLLQQGRVQTDADWNEQGEIADGQAFGDFHFVIGPNSTRLSGGPALLGTGVAGGLAIGNAEGPLAGDQDVHLRLGAGLAVNAFGVEIAFERPDLIDDFALVANCPRAACRIFASRPDPAPTGPGTFFLGITSAAPSFLDDILLEVTTPRDSNGEPIHTVAGWQVVGIHYALVPVPPSVLLLASGLVMMARRRRLKRGIASSPSGFGRPSSGSMGRIR